jgi:hypothetical protein
MRNRLTVYLRYLIVLVLQSSVIVLYTHHFFPRVILLNASNFWIAMGFCFIGDVSRGFFSAGNSGIDEWREGRQERVPFRSWIKPCGECEYCVNGWMCPHTTLRKPTRRRAWFDL